MPALKKPHKNKTLATLLALILGTVGAHRFYLYGKHDIYAWVHTSSALITTFLILTSTKHIFIKISPLLISALAGFITALINGLTSDEKWDQTHNNTSKTRSDSNWQLGLLLVITMIIGSTTLIATIARLFDLLFTGGAYG